MWTVVSRSEPIEIYYLAGVNRKTTEFYVKNKTYFTPFCLNVSSKTIS